ncbi:MAG: cytochrome c oxidase accessory protein CcoG, partial [Pseudomonadota bacterium]
YPREVHGGFAHLRALAVIVLLGLYYGIPWLSWAERQAVLFDLPARKFYVFGLVLWPQDLPLLALLLIVAAITLFFFTAIAGRLWCGYACPQTVWTEAFIWMEQITEGKHRQRAKLDAGPLTLNKVRRKTAKQLLWIAFSLFTGFTFVGYFVPIRELGQSILALELTSWSLFFVLFYSFATYGNAGFMREQVCKYMCPYARFQSAMFDKDTLIIAYDETRGEPRGGRRRGMDRGESSLGDCIDCQMCVQVCPTGIDIRQGLQYECIACAACIDACDSVMEKMNYPKGLVKYTTENIESGRLSKVFRPRVAVYAAVLAVFISILGVALITRTPIILDVLRDRNALYREIPGGVIENVYTLRVVNMDTRPHKIEITVEGIPGVSLDLDDDSLGIPAGAVRSFAARIRVPESEISDEIQKITVALSTDDNRYELHESTVFIGPEMTNEDS